MVLLKDHQDLFVVQLVLIVILVTSIRKRCSIIKKIAKVKHCLRIAVGWTNKVKREISVQMAKLMEFILLLMKHVLRPAVLVLVNTSNFTR